MILLVDDRQENIYSLKQLLVLNHFQVDTATSGEEALLKILKNDYTVIILDVQMPDMDGFEVAEAVTGFSKSKDIPIIFLSAVNTDKTFIAKGYDSGAMDYITKPFDPDILLMKVKTFYRLSMQSRELNEIHHTLLQEVEQRKAAQERLNQSVEELRSVLASIPQIAFTLNTAGEIEFVNHFWFLYSGNEDEFPKTAEGEKSVRQLIDLTLTNEQASVYDVTIALKNAETYRHHLLSLTPVKKNDEILKWVGMFTDIHEQKMMNQILEQRVQERTKELQQINHELEVSNHELQQFAYVASHDLKEPLRKIQVFGNLITSKFLADNHDAKDYMQRIMRSSNRMSNLITDVLSYSKLSIENAFKPVDLNVIMEGIMIDMELLIKEKEAIIRWQQLPVIDVLEPQIRQIFQNILSNALKFAKQDIPLILDITHKRVDVLQPDAPEDENGNYVCLSFADNGIGFNEVYKEKIFSIFQRLHSKEEYEGTGIGLAIVKKIIENHKGKVFVESKEGIGTTFHILLPVAQKV
ncbi:response regulator [Gynurincola endophyticus]|uniref:response regulator n=1 Tax=Gynurincola endophyticus TaxID=2479004 RepID=UPI000F8E3623|nr:response regulator [Gynurincola endophyticus]